MYVKGEITYLAEQADFESPTEKKWIKRVFHVFHSRGIKKVSRRDVCLPVETYGDPEFLLRLGVNGVGGLLHTAAQMEA